MKTKEIKDWYIANNKVFFSSIELTQNCNFRCNHCYCADKEGKNLPVEDWITIIDKLHDIGCLFLNFTGGEIFTYKYFKEVYTYAKNKGFIIDLLTNISLLDEQLLALFKELPPHNIAITVYGTCEEDYLAFTGNANNFNKAMVALELLKQNNIPFALRTVATKTLQKSLLNKEFEKLAERFNTTFKYDPVVFPKTTGDSQPLNECMGINDIIELEKNTPEREQAWREEILSVSPDKTYEWSCRAGVNSMAIDFEGNAFICGLYRKNPISLLRNDISSVLEHLQEIHKEHMKVVSCNKCSCCDKRKICKWCPAYSNIYNGNDHEKIDFFCELAKGRVEAFGQRE